MSNINSIRPIEILLVEDNPGDVRLTLEVLKDAKVNNRVSIARDGEEAMSYLYKKGKFEKAKRPDLILLDWNLPKKDGYEVLIEMKTNDKLKSIPVVVLTTSEAEEDIIKAYAVNANCFISKPVDLDQFIRVIQLIEEFWMTIVKLPRS
jgi:two-component system, chemotaxis family, response regulator Rcp1